MSPVESDAAAVDPEVEEATKAALTHREAYAARLSTTTRNPHSARKGRSLKELMKLPHEERVIVQWRTSFGCPISDEAKAQFGIQCLGQTFALADVRLWLEKHPQKNRKELQTRHVYLEFFFDGQLSEIEADPALFERCFAEMIENQLQEKRRHEFRKKLAARKRKGAQNAPIGNVEDAEGTAGSCIEDDSEWRAYLKKPVAPTELSYRATREAGCMIRFLVCQTSLSVSATEELGQLSFPEHFPIDGKEQEVPLSTKPLPTWVYWATGVSAIFTLITICILWHVFKDAFTKYGPSTPLPL
jgi:hypothetical protein